MTRRERMERRRERRLEWAAGRDKKSAAGFDKAHKIGDMIPFGQPILVGHHSERHARRDQDRIMSGMLQGCESAKMAELHRSKAAGISDTLDRSIFSDDPDAPERLREKIAGLEAERARIKSYNESARRAAKIGGVGDTTLLTEAERKDLLVMARVCAFQLRPGAGFPAYKSANLSGNIARLKGRLEEIERKAYLEAGQSKEMEHDPYSQV